MMLAWLPDIDRGYGDAYTRLADAIEGAIRSGRLKAGERLPTHRALARQLGVAISTVTRGYAEATDRGLLESTVGRGTFVRSAANASTARGPEMRPMERMYVSAVPEADIIDLSLNHPLREGAGKSLGDSLSAMIAGSDLDELSLYHPPHGNAEHRAAGSEWLRFMGVEADPGDVMVIAGGQTGLLSILLAFARRGDVVLSESLTWPGALAIAQSVGMRLESVEMDEEGIDPERFEEACKHFAPRLLYTMPTLQNPTTATASVGRRQEIVRIAREHGVLIVEDDAYGF
ncbi:PLP-dependent aminotransferase family protein, partial [Bauldia litoralis]